MRWCDCKKCVSRRSWALWNYGIMTVNMLLVPMHWLLGEYALTAMSAATVVFVYYVAARVMRRHNRKFPDCLALETVNMLKEIPDTPEEIYSRMKQGKRVVFK